jgi:predicted nuclease with TOPRIM domain
MLEALHNSTQEELVHSRAIITSKSYFTVLQTLRICRNWIDEVTKNLDDLRKRMGELKSSKSLESRWDMLEKQREGATDELLDRIRRIEVEFKSLLSQRVP